MMRFLLLDLLTIGALLSLAGICGFVGFTHIINEDHADCQRMREDACKLHTWRNLVCQTCGKLAKEGG